MAYIENLDVYKAVNFAGSMIKKGTNKGLAIHKAAVYYDVPRNEVASALGKRGNENSRQSYLRKKNG